LENPLHEIVFMKLGIGKGDVSRRQQAMLVAMIGALPGSTKVCKFSSSCHCFYHFRRVSHSPITIVIKIGGYGITHIFGEG
jgi:hypothetical protein